MGLIAKSVARLLPGRSVISQPVRLDNKAELGPEEVDAEAAHPCARLWCVQPRPPSERQKPALQLRVRKYEGVAIEKCSQGRDTGAPRDVIEGRVENVRVDQITLVGLADRAFEGGPGQDGGEIDE